MSSRHAGCAGADPEAWFPLQPQRIHPGVLEICEACPLQVHCAQLALDINAEYGIWAGIFISPRTVRVARARLAAVAAAPPAQVRRRAS